MYCHIRVRGHLDPSWSYRLGGLRIEHEAGGTSLLHGLVPDQAALYGILLRINALGLTLLSLETSAAARHAE